MQDAARRRSARSSLARRSPRASARTTRRGHGDRPTTASTRPSATRPTQGGAATSAARPTPTPSRSPRPTLASSSDRLQRRQRPLPQALGVGALLDPGRPTGSGRCSTPAPARAATSRTAAAIRRRGDGRRPPSRCSCACRSRRRTEAQAPCWRPPAAAIAEPTYGGQLQDFARPGPAGRGPHADRLRGGPGGAWRRRASSRCAGRPTRIDDLGYGPLHPEVDDLAARRAADDRPGPARGDRPRRTSSPAPIPTTRDGDGISGRANCVVDREHRRADARPLRLEGRRADACSSRAADAFAGDIGISTRSRPQRCGDCTAAQAACRDAPHGGDARRPRGQRRACSSSSPSTPATSRVPARRDVDDARRARAASGCSTQPAASTATRRSSSRSDARRPAGAPQPADPALHRPAAARHGRGPRRRPARRRAPPAREWRTPPLWGIGLTETVNGHTLFLHDGRARNLLEAILWHGGEAEAAPRAVSPPCRPRSARRCSPSWSRCDDLPPRDPGVRRCPARAAHRDSVRRPTGPTSPRQRDIAMNHAAPRYRAFAEFANPCTVR